MLAARDQENLVQAHRKAAFSRANGKEKNVFVTPAGPRNRAPLGMKTTNLKANAQAPIQPSALKSVSPRLRRAKVKVHQPENEALGDDDEEREIEIMPHRGTPLPDFPQWFSPDFDLSALSADTSPRKIWMDLNDPKKSSLKFEREMERSGRATDELLQDAISKCYEGIENRSVQSKSKKAAPEPKSRTTSRPLAVKQSANTKLASKSATPALSRPIHAVPSFTLPTVNSKAKLPSSKVLSKKAPPPSKVQTAPVPSRHQNAALASRSTLGYSKGRTTSSSLQKSKKSNAALSNNLELRKVSSHGTSGPASNIVRPANKSYENDDSYASEEDEAMERLAAMHVEDDIPKPASLDALFSEDPVLEDFQLELLDA